VPRLPGSPNRRTLLLKAELDAAGVDLTKDLLALLPDLPPLERAKVLLELMGFVYPKRKAIDPPLPTLDESHFDVAGEVQFP